MFWVAPVFLSDSLSVSKYKIDFWEVLKKAQTKLVDYILMTILYGKPFGVYQSPIRKRNPPKLM